MNGSTSELRCVSCRAALPKTGQFCPRCGAPMPVAAPQSPTPAVYYRIAGAVLGLVVGWLIGHYGAGRLGLDPTTAQYIAAGCGAVAGFLVSTPGKKDASL